MKTFIPQILLLFLISCFVITNADNYNKYSKKANVHESETYNSDFR